ncbi:TetR/AcrR family transcriptional regulator [Streptomyces sp. P9(2023)]|uniref:TetR/AcrR family transcriptional regulator n=1 Tax=Streptomyces sp. P9(2023) TaxID=3064394 RepID=UPI0028F3FAFF|nr:TetR/AcrR family transcriptional regulator [Streptomyces sp. P9(2023)]MDT9687208.1 TetR/AcrR family transcriptional regulator [Streptomyces sp. P9(2023)]
MKDRKTAILKAAARVIAHHGVRGLRVEELAAEAHVSKPLVYYHFGDRAGLLRHTLRFIGDRAERYTAAQDAAAEDPAQELQHRLLLELRDTPEVRENSTAWGELRASAVFEPELREELARASHEWVREIADLLGRVDPTAPAPALVCAAERLTVLLEGLSTRWLIGLVPAGHAAELMRGAIEAEVEGLDLGSLEPRTACAVTVVAV